MPVNICSMNGISATRRFIPPLSPGAAPITCYRCANAYFDLAARYRFIWLRETVLSVEMLEDKHIQHHTLTEAILGARGGTRQRINASAFAGRRFPLFARRWQEKCSQARP
ncbi:DNA-binding transcriptional regulator CsiR [Salmonella enterica subsp. enterica]|uniref:DNA-binding transcriptional regulator CsiR n=1 Tax=Salmonella enterica I TaxID=59201 RepID=A0A447N580_SALET|nr:DNA-binding transcriptional regulator CsiR [Salmonella enterica subsp. enterica]